MPRLGWAVGWSVRGGRRRVEGDVPFAMAARVTDLWAPMGGTCGPGRVADVHAGRYDVCATNGRTTRRIEVVIG